MIVIGSNQKIRKETDWSPAITLETSIEDILSDWKERLKNK